MIETAGDAFSESLDVQERKRNISWVWWVEFQKPLVVEKRAAATLAQMGLKTRILTKQNTPEQDTVKLRRFSSDPKAILEAYKDILVKISKTEHGHTSGCGEEISSN